MVKKRAISAGERGDVEAENRTGGSHLKKKKMMKKNLQRLGGKGLSLEAFANAKTRSNDYNPSLISNSTFPCLLYFHVFLAYKLVEF